MSTVARALCPVRRTPDDEGEQVTQLLPGEPVEVLETVADWTRVVAPWQPSSLDPAGYPGWVLAAHLGEVGETATHPAPADAADGEALVAAAAGYLDTPYLWGGLSADGIDCSGLVHMAYRRLGRLVPRDATPQEDASDPVEEPRYGDLVTYGREATTHIAFWLGGGRILHAAGGRGVVEEPEPGDLRVIRRRFVRLRPTVHEQDLPRSG